MGRAGQERMVGQVVGGTEVIVAVASGGLIQEVEGMEGASGDRGLQYWKCESVKRVE